MASTGVGDQSHVRVDLGYEQQCLFVFLFVKRDDQKKMQSISRRALFQYRALTVSLSWRNTELDELILTLASVHFKACKNHHHLCTLHHLRPFIPPSQSP